MKENPGVISSTGNARIKQVRALRQRKMRQSSGLFVVEGLFAVGEALEAAREAMRGVGRGETRGVGRGAVRGAALRGGREKAREGGVGAVRKAGVEKGGAGADIFRPRVEVEAVFYAPELLSSDFGQDAVRAASDRGVDCHATSADVFRSISERENPQGILAVVRMGPQQLGELNASNFPWGVALVNPQDAGNLGTIVRTVDAVGAAGVVVLDGGVDPQHPNAVRASMGALFWHAVVRATFEEFTRWAERQGYHVYGSSAKGEKDYRQVEAYQRPLILLLGSEREGLNAEQRGFCHELVNVPMGGRVTSLNLAVAAGVLLYAMVDKAD